MTRNFGITRHASPSVATSIVFLLMDIVFAIVRGILGLTIVVVNYGIRLTQSRKVVAERRISCMCEQFDMYEACQRATHDAPESLQ